MDLSFVPAAPGAAFGAMPAGGYPAAAGRSAAGAAGVAGGAMFSPPDETPYAHAGFAHDRGGMFSPPECGVSPPSNAAAAQPSQRRRTEPPLTLRIEVPSGSPFRVPATPTPSPSPPAAAAAAAAPTPDLRMLADLFPAVALRIMKCLDDHALVALSLASTRLNDITEIAAKRKTVEYLSLKTGKGLVVDEAFRGYSERSRWKRMAHCASAVRHFSGLACITSPIEPGDVLAYLHQFPQPSLQSAHRHTNQAVDDAIDRELGANALLRRGVVRFMNGFIVGALYDFLMARENHLFTNCSSEPWQGCVPCRTDTNPTAKSKLLLADAVSPTTKFSARGLFPADDESKREIWALARLCALKVFMPPWWGLEPMATPRVRTPRASPTTMRQQRCPVELGEPATAEDKLLMRNFMWGNMPPDEFVAQFGPEGNADRAAVEAKLALPVCRGNKLIIGRMMQCSCFLFATAETPLVSFLVHASDAERVTARDAWEACLEHMPLCNHHELENPLSPSCMVAKGVIDLSNGAWTGREATLGNYQL